MTKIQMQFFAGAGSCPMAVGDLLVTLAAGVPVAADRVPSPLLPCVLLLAKVAREESQPELVDDYDLLKQRVREALELEVPSFWHPQGFIAASIASGNLDEEDTIVDIQDTAYLLPLYMEMTHPDRYIALLGMPEKRRKKAA